MFFIALLVATTMAVAGAAAYFSVYGLAYTFSGVFWSVVAMGVSLEAAKLMAASYLYRYWTRTNLALKAYLIGGTAALMLLTSVGIFGYLSVGYQQDILPLKQKKEQISILEEERTRILERKKQIDELMSQGPAVNNITRADGTIDPRASRTIAAAQRARSAVVQQYRVEQTEVNARVKQLDGELLELKQATLQAEAKVGPIAFIAQAFGLPTDNATKYLIFIIIFAFDPMAVALTIAVNTALRIRKEESKPPVVDLEELPPSAPPVPNPALFAPTPPPAPEPTIEDVFTSGEMAAEVRQPPVELSLVDTEPTPPREPLVEEAPVVEEVVEEPVPTTESPEPVHEEEDEPPVEVMEPPAVVNPVTSTKSVRPYPSRWNIQGDTADNIRELISHHKYLKAKRDNGDTLTEREMWELSGIEDVLRKRGIDLYLNS